MRSEGPRADQVTDTVEATPGHGYSPAALTAIRLSLDALALASAAGLAIAIRFGLRFFEITESTPVTAGAHVVATALWTGGVLVAFATNRLYDADTLFPGGGELARVVRSIIEGAALLSAFVFLTQSFAISRSWFGLTVVLSNLLLLLERRVVGRVLRGARAEGRLRRPAILVSQGGHGWEEWPLERESEFVVVAHAEPDGFEAFVAPLSGRRAWPGAAVIVRARDFTGDQFWRILILSGQLGWSVFVHSPVRSVGRDRLTLRVLGGQTIVKVAPPTLSGTRSLMKRVFDVGFAVVALILLSPILLVISLLILVTSGWPILYMQERVGLGGRTFKMLKFRTMRRGSDAENPEWTAPNDPRRTAIGGPLRRSSLDELPQLLNVIAGHMSLVGPRPERPVFVGRFTETIDWYAFRHRIRPGITGWAQAHGLRGDTPLDLRVEHDNWYIENWSVFLDLKILGRTLIEIVRGRSAY